ncbi:hypothetical protein BC834DRAFT_503581 [Gloeopeniophorella convolvens]|nr:hypothetical protein BC834DRAFT_503581 [Gloeopeniophorella convolvens]
MTVTEMCWKAEYKGSAAAVFVKYLRRLACDPTMLPRARTFVVVQSSGMGKSRMVNEVAKTVITVPMNFHSDDIDKGYPPPDNRLRQWLLGLSGIEDAEGRTDPETRKDRVTTRCEAFVESLLTTLLSHLEGISAEAPSRVKGMRVDDLAQRFREKMEEDQSFKGHGKYRETFYEEVISGATKIIETTTASHASTSSSAVTDATPPLSGSRKWSRDEDTTLKRAAERLVDALKDRLEFRGNEQPTVLLAFDGSHEFKTFSRTRLRDGDPGWSLYSELRSALRQLVGHPIFSVFLPSTPVYFSSPKLPTEFDLSSRIQRSGLKVLIPYSELGFDNLAIRVADDGALRLDDVACLKHMCSLGRPLFATRYLCGDESIKAAVIDFATDQLLAMRMSSGTMLSKDQKLACLAVRLPLEFTLDSALSSNQVEEHMRVCLSAEPGGGLQGLLTVASSEPLLAEASMRAFKLSQSNASEHLRYCMQSSDLSTGGRGELAASLMLLTARDDALGSHEGYTVSVVQFLEALIGKGVSGDGVKPYCFRDNDITSGREPLVAETPLRETFRRSRIWFNHFIRVRSDELINRCYLWRYIVRGAAVCCATGGKGVHFVIPFIYHDAVLASSNVSAILIQVQDDDQFQTSIHPPLFDGIDPFRINLFSQKSQQKSLPVIRMVFALGASDSAVEFREPLLPQASGVSQHQYTAYDIWCAGATPATFLVIKDADQEHYREMIKMPGSLSDPYAEARIFAPRRGLEEERSGLRQMMYPGAGTDDEFFSQYVDLSKSTCDDLGMEVRGAQGDGTATMEATEDLSEEEEYEDEDATEEGESGDE